MTATIRRGSGNVFEDLGFEQSAEHKAKADLALQVIQVVTNRNLTQQEAAKLIGARQADISNLKNGQLKGFTLERLISFLLKLDRSIQIRVSKPKKKSKQGILETVAA